MQLKRNQQLLQVDATSPRGLHLNYFRKYIPLGRETNCIPRRGQSACNYATSHNSDLPPPRGSIVHRPCTSDTAVIDGAQAPPRICLLAKKRVHVCKSRFVQTTSRYRRVGRAVLLFRVGISCELFVRTCTALHGVGVMPTFSNVLSGVLQGSPTLSGALQFALRRQIVEILTEISVVLSPRTPGFLLTSLLHICDIYECVHVK